MKINKFENKLKALIEKAYTGGLDGYQIDRLLITTGLTSWMKEQDIQADRVLLALGEGESTFTLECATAGYRIVENEAVKPDLPAVQPDSALLATDEPPALVVNAVAAIRTLVMEVGNSFTAMDDAMGLRFEAIDQLLDKMMIVTDADIPAYIRTIAMGSRRLESLETGRVLDNLAEQIEQGLHVGREDWHKALVEFIQEIGEHNVKVGWWSDANTDLRTCDYAPHVFASKMMLVVSEMSEAMEGHRKSKPTKTLMDDHLPDRPMVEVEFADALIRIFDLAANYRLPNGKTIDVPGAIRDKIAYNAIRPDHKVENRAKDGGKGI